MIIGANQATAIVKLNCAIQDFINSLILKGLNGSEISVRDIKQAIIYTDRLKHEISSLKDIKNVSCLSQLL